MVTQPPQDASGGAPPARRVDARSLRGLAHPLRVQLLELLALDGPATSAELARRLGQNTGTVSWHLRHLAEHGYIEDEPGRGTKRERWWRKTDVEHELTSTDFPDDPEARSALDLVRRELVDQHLRRVRAYVDGEWDDTWRSAGTIADRTDLRLTPQQLTDLNTELLAVLARHRPPRDVEPAPDALPVVVQLQSFPRAVPPVA